MLSLTGWSPIRMGTITTLLDEARSGRADAVDRLFSHVYEDLKAVARRFSGNAPRNGLQATEIVHVAYQRLASREGLNVENRRQFFYVLSRAMHDILVEQARNELAQKRGGGIRRETLIEVAWEESSKRIDILDLQNALADLGAAEPDVARIVMLRFYAGMTLEETAETVGCSFSTVRGHWDYAKAWLRARLMPPDDGG